MSTLSRVSRVRWAGALATIVAGVCAPVLDAGACPACAANSAEDSGALWAVGLFMLVPFAVAAVAAWALGAFGRNPAADPGSRQREGIF